MFHACFIALLYRFLQVVDYRLDFLNASPRTELHTSLCSFFWFLLFPVKAVLLKWLLVYVRGLFISGLSRIHLKKKHLSCIHGVKPTVQVSFFWWRANREVVLKRAHEGPSYCLTCLLTLTSTTAIFPTVFYSYFLRQIHPLSAHILHMAPLRSVLRSGHSPVKTQQGFSST